MKVARKLLVTGGASLVLAGGVVALPSALPVGATHDNHRGHQLTKKPESYVLKEESNATYRVKTEVSPRGHLLWSTVTNKTNAAISPSVTFNGEAGASYGNKPLEPGKSRTYVHAFSGNNFTLDVAVAAQGVDTFTSSAVVNLQEPVSFKTTSTDAENKTITGTLTNNTTEQQTVYVKGDRKSKTTETLSPNESKTITVSSSHDSHRGDKDKRHSDKHHDDKFVRVSLATEAGYKASYIVPLVTPTTEPIPLDD